MSFTSSDLSKLINSKKYQDYKKENYKFLLLWEKIYSRRKDLWFKQDELGKLAWIPQNKISKLENWTYWEPWNDILERLSMALKISIEYFTNNNITRKTVEMYNYLLSKFEKTPDVMQFMKLPYFIDLESIKCFWKQISNFEYIRWHYWPFDKKVYDYQKLFSIDFEKWFSDMKTLYLSKEEVDLINKVLNEKPKDNWEKLKLLSYETEPMKKLWVSIWDLMCMWKVLELV